MRFIKIFAIVAVIATYCRTVDAFTCGRNTVGSGYEYSTSFGGAGCFCAGGSYGRQCTEGDTTCGDYATCECASCPPGGQSDLPNNTSYTNCYTTTSNCYNSYAHGSGSGRLYYEASDSYQPWGAGCFLREPRGTQGYTNCQISNITSCDAGYYRTSSTTCSPVSPGYYSPAGATAQTPCPPASSIMGETGISISGGGASENDCVKSFNSSGSDSTGAFTVSPTSCNYR